MRRKRGLGVGQEKLKVKLRSTITTLNIKRVDLRIKNFLIQEEICLPAKTI